MVKDMFKIFRQRQLKDAMEFVANNPDKFAIHLHRIVFDNSPGCFHKAVQSGYPIAHVFCRSLPKLIALAEDAGVKKLFVHFPRKERQHIDLCGKPLEYVLTQAGTSLELFRK